MTTDSGTGVASATETASSSADCRLALAAFASALLASFSFFVCRFLGEALTLPGVDLLGEAALAPRLLLLCDAGGGDSLISFSVLGSSNLGGSAIFFLALVGLDAISLGSRRAVIQWVRP